MHAYFRGKSCPEAGGERRVLFRGFGRKGKGISAYL